MRHRVLSGFNVGLVMLQDEKVNINVIHDLNNNKKKIK